MAGAKDWLRDRLPPVLWRGARRLLSRGTAAPLFSGPYDSWQAARQASSGYESPLILEKVRAATLKVLAGEAAYERDTVTFTEPQADDAKLAGLRLAAGSGRLSVLDLGGALGSAYHQNRRYLDMPQGLRWSVVEQAQFAACGAAQFQTDELRFYDDLEACIEKENPNVALLSGVLGYLEDPLAMLRKLAAHRLPYILIDRTPEAEDDVTRLAVQRVSARIYDASYPCWIFGRGSLAAALGEGYRLIESFDSAIEAPVACAWGTVRFRGWRFRTI